MPPPPGVFPPTVTDRFEKGSTIDFGIAKTTIICIYVSANDDCGLPASVRGIRLVCSDKVTSRVAVTATILHGGRKIVAHVTRTELRRIHVINEKTPSGQLAYRVRTRYVLAYNLYTTNVGRRFRSVFRHRRPFSLHVRVMTNRVFSKCTQHFVAILLRNTRYGKSRSRLLTTSFTGDWHTFKLTPKRHYSFIVHNTIPYDRIFYHGGTERETKERLNLNFTRHRIKYHKTYGYIVYIICGT